MSEKPSEGEHRLTIYFELDRKDNTRLYDDLVRFAKGTKRVNRLRTLAHEGLLAQHWSAVPKTADGRGANGGGAAAPEENAREARSVTLQMFEEPISD